MISQVNSSLKEIEISIFFCFSGVGEHLLRRILHSLGEIGQSSTERGETRDKFAIQWVRVPLLHQFHSVDVPLPLPHPESHLQRLNQFV